MKCLDLNSQVRGDVVRKLDASQFLAFSRKHWKVDDDLLETHSCNRESYMKVILVLTHFFLRKQFLPCSLKQQVN